MTREQNCQIYRNGETSWVCKMINFGGCIFLCTGLTVFMSYSAPPEKKGEKTAVSSAKPHAKLQVICLSESAAADRP